MGKNHYWNNSKNHPPGVDAWAVWLLRIGVGFAPTYIRN